MKFTKRRQAWADQRQSARLVGSPLKPSAAVAKRYQKDIDRLVTAMLKDYQREIAALYRREGGVTMDASLASQARILMNGLGDKWAGLFRKVSSRIVERMIGQADKAASASLGQSLKELSGGLTIKTPEMPAGLKDRVTAAVADNVALIKSIPEQYHYRVQGAVLRSIQDGGEGAADIYRTAYREITEVGINVHKRASLIARLETAKVSAMIQQERLQSAGVTKFRWRHSGGGAEPRELHLEYDGQIFDLNDPPIIDERSGQRGMPGTIWNCRCFAEPIIELGEQS